MIVFGSRGSDLALTQTRQVARMLEARTGEPFRVEIIETKGDRDLSKPLPEIGGKGLFTAELEDALLRGAIDVAVHSLKDLPVADPDGLMLGAVPARVSPHDVLVCRPDAIDESRSDVPLRHGARVGTSSLRRAGALRARHADLVCESVRGNVPTRVDKVRRGDYDAVVLAAAGLERLGLDLSDLRRVPLSVELCPPAPGQGALGVQCRRDDHRVRPLLAELHDEASARAVTAERALLAALGGGCSMPLGAHVEPEGDLFRVRAALFARAASRVGAARVDRVGSDLDSVVDEIAALLKPLVDEPLAGRDVSVVRSRGAARDFEDWLAVAGAQVQRIEATVVEPIHLTARDLKACSGHAFAFTSPRGVERFFAEVARVGGEFEPAAVYAVGRATAAALADRGHHSEVPPDGAGGARLAQHILDGGLASSVPIAFPCAERCEPGLARSLEAAGRTVVAMPVYRTVPVQRARPEVDADSKFKLAPLVVICAPSGARAIGTAALEGRTLVALGESTARGIAELGLSVGTTAAAATPAAIVAAVTEAC